MKKISTLLVLLFSLSQIWAQTGNVGIGTAVPRAAAMLDVTNANKGFLMPRINIDPTTLSNNFFGNVLSSAPGTDDRGLIFFNTFDAKYWYWDGTQWLSIPDNDWIIAGNNEYAGVPGNVGIGTPTPAAKLHVVTNGNIILENMAIGGDSTVLVMNPLTGVVARRNLPTSSWDGDNQTLSINGFNLSISGGNTVALPIPTITAGIGLVSSGVAPNQMLDVQAVNGLTADATLDAVKLGGPLIENTTITNNVFNLNVDLNGAGNFQVQKNGGATPLLKATNANTGQVIIDDAAVATATNPHALFQMNSNSKGVIFPNLTTAQRNAIAVTIPQDVGLTIFNLDKDVHEYWNGQCWLPVGTTICTDFSTSLSSNSGCIYTSAASSVQIDVTVTLNSGVSVPVIMAVGGLPNGVTASFASTSLFPTATTQLTITGTAAAIPGVYPLQVMAIFGTLVQSATYTLQIVPGSITISSTAGTVNEINVAPNNNIVTTDVGINFVGGCSNCNSALLSVSGTPPGVSAMFSTNPIPTAGGLSTLTFTATSCADTGMYNLTITANLCGQLVTFPYDLHIIESHIYAVSNSNNYNLFTSAGSPPCPVVLVGHINSGIVISSTSTATPAYTTGPFVPGSKITIDVAANAGILGKGGEGGKSDCSYFFPNCLDTNGKPGGPALSLETPNVTINMNSTGLIGGGGGGGGSGFDLSPINTCISYQGGSGGGGGAGGGLGQVGCCNPPATNGANGGFNTAANGTLAGGTGGNGNACQVTCTIIPCIFGFATKGCYRPGDGGAGGGFGLAGQNGFTDRGETIFNCGAANCNGTGTLSDPADCDGGQGGAPGRSIVTNNHPFSVIVNAAAPTAVGPGAANSTSYPFTPNQCIAGPYAP
ncbi:MAG: hypothetical protein ACKVTZ_15575 [Bacteroidia bacterium]